MLIRAATLNDIPSIHKLAHKIWRETYQEILSTDQIEFMLNDMYSNGSLETQFKNGITFLIVETSDKPIAFASYSLSEPQKSLWKIHKLYILSSEHGKGIGRQLLDHIKQDVIAGDGKILELNVNRHNPALNFYKKYGFSILKEVDIPYHQYRLNDYVMSMHL